MSGRMIERRAAGFGRETLEPRFSMPRHRHEHGYIAVVLAGGYHEAGNAGRFDVKAGDVVVHRSYDAHLDNVGNRGADVLNLPLPRGTSFSAAFRIDDPDAIARTAERDVLAAALSLVPTESLQRADDWPDQLASDLTDSPPDLLRSWAHLNEIAPETLSRRFRKAYGVTPAVYRAEVRAQRALAMIRDGDSPLAAIAAECGFADQPHLTRMIVRLTGHPPGFWRRRSIWFKTG